MPSPCDAVWQYLILCGNKGIGYTSAMLQIGSDGPVGYDSDDFAKEALRLQMAYNDKMSALLLKVRGGQYPEGQPLP